MLISFVDPLSLVKGEVRVREHADLGLNAKWATGWPGTVMSAAARRAIDEFKTKGDAFVIDQEAQRSNARRG